MTEELELRVPATLSNLGPGFDCFGLSVDLDNVIRARPAAYPSLRFTGPHAGDLPHGPESLLWRSFERCRDRFGLSPPPLEVVAEVRVPPGRGLGSSATAVAAGLALAVQFGGRRIPRQQLCALGAAIEGHPDNIVPALVGGLCLCLPEDGKHLRFEPPPGLRFVAISPASQVSTAEARAALPQSLPLRDAVYNLGLASVLAAALVSGRLEEVGELDLILDKLHQPTRSRHIPGFAQIVRAGREAGALGVCISGSGPTVLALVTGRDRAVAQAMTQELERQGIRAETRMLSPTASGVLAQVTEID